MNCEQCGLKDKGKQITLPEVGDRNYKYAVVWNNPQLEETRTNGKGGPFSSVKGKVVIKALEKLGFNLDDFLFTYSCQCASYNDRDASISEMNCCEEFLLDQLKKHKVEKVVTLGVGPLRGFFGKAVTKLDDFRGIPIQHEETGLWILPTVDPGMCYRVPNVFIDLCNDISKLNWNFPFPQVDLKYEVVSDWRELITAMKQIKECHPCYAIDIETNTLNKNDANAKILSLAITTTENYTYVISEECLSDDTSKEILITFFGNTSNKFCGHTAIQFDAPFIGEVLGITPSIAFEIPTGHYIYDVRVGTHSLDDVAREILGIKSWKYKARQYIIEDGATYENIPKDTLHEYNAEDTLVTMLLWKHLEAQLIQSGKLNLHNKMIEYSYCLQEMYENGFQVDRDRMLHFGFKCLLDADDKTKAFAKRIGKKTFNPNSSQQVAAYLYDELELRPVPGKGRTTKGEVLKILAEENESPELEEIIEIRQLKKLKSTYIDKAIDQLDSNNKLHMALKIHGTVTGRLSSTWHSIPKRVGKEFRKGFIASPGYTLISADYSQLELRVATWYSREKTFIDTFNNNVDVHTGTAAYMFNKPINEVTDLERYSAKSVNFGVIFGIGADKLSRNLKCSKETAQSYLDDYYASKPDLRRWIDEIIAFARKNQYVEMPTGRRRDFPLRTNSNYLEIDREAVNTMVQNVASDICLDSQVRLRNTKIDPRIRLIFSIHDNNIIEVPTEILNEAALWMKQTMEDVPEMGYLKDRPIKITVDVEVGTNWGEMVKWQQ